MLLLKTDRLPGGDHWAYQLKLDGYRAIALKSGGKVHLRSRNDKDFVVRYPSVVKGLCKPDEPLLRAIANGRAVLLRADNTWAILPDRPTPLYQLARHVGTRVAVLDCCGTYPAKATVMLIDRDAARLRKPINRRGVILIKGAPPHARRIVRGD